MGWQALGDSAWLMQTGGTTPATRLQRCLATLRTLTKRRIPEVLDLVSSFDSVAVHFDPPDGERVLSWLEQLADPETRHSSTGSPERHEIPTLYGGTGLADTANALGLTSDEVVRLHSSADYTVAALGFSPGFPYLLGLPERLRLPRLATPRPVPAGSVAIAGSQAGIYPNASQGGWHVLGATNRVLFDPAANPPALLQPGDRIRFVPTGSLTERDPPTTLPPDGPVEVIEPGPLATIQGPGRHGCQRFGVSPGGSADPVTARITNLLVGNPGSSALLECPLQGPVLRFHQAMRIAFVGWDDPRSGKPVDIAVGETLDLRSRMRQPVGYLAIAGGIDTPLVLGSRATDLRAGFGGLSGRNLRAGDRLPIGKPATGPATGDWHAAPPRPSQVPLEIRMLPGIQVAWFTDESRRAFTATTYHTGRESDRMGLRLDGPRPVRIDDREMLSQPVAAGSIQIPPDGRPIILLAERQTIGGYPQIGHVISADLRLLAQAWPGTPVRFREVGLADARSAWSDQQRDLRLLRNGLDLLT